MQGYLVVVEGDYFGRASEMDRKRDKFPYRVTVKVPSPEGALSLIKNKLLDKVLRRNYDNYHTYRTHQLVSITNLDGSKVYGLSDPRLMDFNDLADYVRRNKLPLKLDLYTDLGYFRTMVFLAETNQHEFRIKQAKLQQDYEEDMKLAELNPEIFSSQGSKPHRLPVEERYGRSVGVENCVGDKVDVRMTAPEMTKKAVLKYRSEGASKVVKQSNADYIRETQERTRVALERDRTIITEGKRKEVKETKHVENDLYIAKPVEAEMQSALITEDVPKTQKVEKVFVAGRGYVDVRDFKEDFQRPEEKEFEVYDPARINTVHTDKSEEEPAALKAYLAEKPEYIEPTYDPEEPTQPEELEPASEEEAEEVGEMGDHPDEFTGGATVEEL